MRKDVPLAVEVPNAERDKPAWVKVGVIAAVGFIVGIAWPRVMGVKLGPNAPGESAAAAAAASASGHPGRAPDAPPASVAKMATPIVSASNAPGSGSGSATAVGLPPNIVVQRGTVLSCKTADGETKKGKECGAVGALDQVVSPRVRRISTCSGIEGQTGKLSLVISADFAAGRISYEVGKASTVANLDAVQSCLKTSFHGTTIDKVAHEHARYTVVYNAVFAPGTRGDDASDDKPTAHKDKDKDKDKPDPKEKSAKENPDENKSETPTPPAPPANAGEAAVAWEVALVRDAPKTGAVVARLPRGTKVHVGSPKDGWFSIKFGENFATEGYVYRGAIGR